MKQEYFLSNVETPNTKTKPNSTFGIKNKKNNYVTFLFNCCQSILTLFLFFSASYSQAQTKIIYTSNALWTCPEGVTSITVEAWGAGAGGRNNSGAKGSTGPGGGGGAYARINTVSVTPGATYTLTVGGQSNPNANGASSTATFGTRTILAAGGLAPLTAGLNATGGIGGLAATPASIGDVTFGGGNGGKSNGTTANGGSGAGGGGGSGGGSTSTGNPGSDAATTLVGGAGGAIANNLGGPGGKGGDNDSNGATPSGPGYGGGGGGAGDLGGQGYVIVAGRGQSGAIIITLNLTYGPGGVTNNLQLWLRSDLLDGTTSVADNTAVSTWRTQAVGDNATKPSTVGAPIYRNNAAFNINFNSVVDFTNAYNSPSQVFTDSDATRQYLKGASGFHSQDMFVVTIPDVTISSAIRRMDLFCGDNSGVNDLDDTGIGFGDYTTRFTGEALTYALGTSSEYGIAAAGSYSAAGIINTRNNDATSPTAQELFYNGINLNPLATPVTFSNVTNSQYWIGRSKAYTGNLDARVAEVITYNSRASDAERSNIRSYLAIKYGITLGVNGTTMNYTDSAGTIIWNATVNAGYNFDIAGIGRNDITKLTQKQSRTINNPNGITIGLGDIAATNTANTNVFDSDRKFLVWGNDGGSTAAQSVAVNLSSGILPALTTDVSYQRITKIWKVVETGGDVSTCKVAIPTTQIAAAYTAAATATGDYVMLISSTSTFDANSEVRIMTVNGSNLETTYNFDGTKYISFGFAPEKTFVRCIKFDGINDYLDAGNVLNLNTQFTVSAWVQRSEVNQTILSKRDASFTQGYELGINGSGQAEMNWMVGSTKFTITSNATIPINIWHHIAITFDGTTAKLYVNGVNKICKTASTPTNSNNSFLIGAAGGSAPTSFFKGSIDEVRIWSLALTAMQLKYVMNQEIINNAGLTNGVIIPNTITLNETRVIPWTNLTAYYPMSTFSINNVKDKSGYALTAALKNINTVDLQTAPLPYETNTTGDWSSTSTWKNGAVQELPNSPSIENPASSSVIPPGLTACDLDSNSVDGTIIRVKSGHTLTSLGNKKALALILETGSTLIATASNATQATGSKIEVSHYLKLDGKIDLVGRSQLIQTEGSDLDITSAGSMEKDQQGQSNMFNYNYWSSPVGTINTISNNSTFTVGGVLRDGTNPSLPSAINWVSGFNGSASSPISLARYWIFKFDNATNTYANWIQILETGSLTAGKGFTLKGSGATTATQNLTFVGKPNNGTITNTVSANQLLLIGNPYPSALDADKFIADNTASIDVTTATPATDGALYFWEHYTSNATHTLGGYEGGYGIYNMSGGVAPSSTGVDFISRTGSTSKASPKQYIPVGQGFFVIGNASGGNVVFKNSQRAFVKEDNALSQITYRIPENPKIAEHWIYTGDDPVIKQTYKKIRLGFNVYNEEYHRQVLLAFMNDKANSEMNDGYDAFNLDDAPSDMYLINGENELAISGEGHFDTDVSYPIGVRIASTGKVSFAIDALENFDIGQPVFIHDAETDTYHSIKNELYEVKLPAGTYNNRFTLRFTDKTLGTDAYNLSEADEVNVIVNQNVTVQSTNKLIKTITVFDLSGRKIDSYKKVNTLNYSLSHLNKTTAGLIIKITLENGTVVSKKIIY